MSFRRIVFHAKAILIVCAGILTLFPPSAFSQQYNFKAFSVEQGLAQSQVYSLCQDSKGNLWIGTSGGISKYDGNSFVNYSISEGLNNNVINAIMEDRDGFMWFCTYGGVSRYDGKKFINYTHEDGLSSNKVMWCIQDRTGNIWFATESNGLTKYDGKQFHPYGQDKGLPVRVWTLMEDRKGDIWVGTTGNGVFKFEKDRLINYTVLDGLASNKVRYIHEDKNGKIWLCTSEGLSVFDGSKFTTYTVKDGLPSNVTWSLAEDKEGNLWIAAEGGVSKFDRKKFTNYTKIQGLPANEIYSVLHDREGNVWLGTDGGGLCKFSGEKFVSYAVSEGLPDNIIRSILKDSKGNTWIGTYGGLVKYDGKVMAVYTKENGLAENVVYSILEDKKGNLWFGTGGKGGLTRYDGKSFTVYNEKNGFTRENVYCIMEDRDSVLWLGTNRSGVFRFDGKEFRHYNKQENGLVNNLVRSMVQDRYGYIWFATDSGISRFDGRTFRNYTTQDGMVNKNIISMITDKDGDIWLGTYGGGMMKFNPGKGETKFEVLNSRDGLIDDNVVLMSFDNAGNLWLGTNKGVSCLDVKEYKRTGLKKFKNYGRSEGFIGIECNQNAVYKDDSGNIWFGTVGGVIRYNPKADQPNTVPPLTRVSDIRLSFETVDWKKLGVDSINPRTGLPVEPDFSYKMKHLTFDFIAISLTAPEKVRYKWILEGFDEVWSPETKETHATYSNLGPGHYTFKVMACNNEGLWNPDPVSYSFTITPPFWKTWWFYILCTVSGISCIYLFTQYRIRTLKKQQRLLETMVDVRTRELKEEKEKVEHYNREVTSQKEIIEAKNKDITDSIHYARRIQQAMLPSTELIFNALRDSFILYKPRDVVSGDFYAFAKKGDHTIIAAVDCTGHGVPGAFMSLIGTTLLNDIVNEKGMTEPAAILSQLDESIRIALKQDQLEAETRDGMDIAICTINYDKKELQFAGAFRPLYLFKDNVLSEIKGDKFSIGGAYTGKRIFRNHLINFRQGDSFYMFSDGFVDQFGGPKRKKFLAKRFQDLLLNIQSFSMKEQAVRLENAINEWKGEDEQVDDILVMGVRL